MNDIAIKFCMSKLEEMKIIHGRSWPWPVDKKFCAANADARSVCGS